MFGFIVSVKLSAINPINTQKVNFGQKIFEIANIDDLPCAYCGRKMISQGTVNKLFKSRVSTDASMLEAAKEYGSYLKPFHQDVLSFLARVQYEYDLQNDGQIISKACKLSEDEVSDDIMERFYKIVDIISNSKSRDLKDFLSRNFNYSKSALRRKNSYSELIKFVRSNRFLNINKKPKNKTEAKINEISNDIDAPGEFSIPSYIVKKTETQSIDEFYKDLFSKSVSSIEHLRPQSKGGKDKMSNLLAVCRRCNNERQSISLSAYIKLHPEVVENTEKQLQLLNGILPKLISDNKVDEKYYDYPQKVAKTLNRLSRGRIEVVV